MWEPIDRRGPSSRWCGDIAAKVGGGGVGDRLPQRCGFGVRLQRLRRTVGGVEVDRTIKGVSPLDHAAVIVGMADGDGRDSTDAVDHLDQTAINQRDAVPEDVAVRMCDQQRPLTDGERWLHPDPVKTEFFESHDVAV